MPPFWKAAIVWDHPLRHKHSVPDPSILSQSERDKFPKVNLSSNDLVNFNQDDGEPGAFSSLPLRKGKGFRKVIPNFARIAIPGIQSVSKDAIPLGHLFRKFNSLARLVELRALMQEEPDSGLDYYIIPARDAHDSENLTLRERRHEFISGFTGSRGIFVVSKNSAHAFVDSQYILQASHELDNNWTIHEVPVYGNQSWIEWLKDRPKGSRVGVDSRLISHQTGIFLSSTLKARFSKLVFPHVNLVDKAWKPRPQKPQGKIFLLDPNLTGQSASEKLAGVRTWIKAQRPPAPPAGSETTPVSQDESASTNKSRSPPTATFIASLDSIAWLLNIRGTDFTYNPLLISYLFISLKQAVLFVDKGKLSLEITAYFREIGVKTRDYGDVWSFLRDAEWGDGKVLIDPTVSYAVSLMLTSSRYIIAPSYVDERKAVKNLAEVEKLRDTHLRDGLAMVRWFGWLDGAIRNGERVSEWDAEQKLSELRAEEPRHWGPSQPDVSAVDSNAGIPHYSPPEQLSAHIMPDSIYLISSGCHYLDGTCMTTRTVHFGPPTDEQMIAYTRVLQGHIAIDQAVFPEGTTGLQLDALARKPLWSDGLNYNHETGHNVGTFLNVREGVSGFGTNSPLKEGSVITNEPGYYSEGSFGVKIGSTLVVRRVKGSDRFQDPRWLRFDRLTQVPIQTRMLKMDLMSREEKTWVKEHNAACRANLLPLLGGDRSALRWLEKVG